MAITIGRESRRALAVIALALCSLSDCSAFGGALGGRSFNLSGAWSAPGRTRLFLRHEGEGLHRVSGTWRSKPVEGQALLQRLSTGEARLALHLNGEGGAMQTIWRVSRDRTGMTRGNTRLSREVPAGFVRLKVMTYNIKGIWHLGRVSTKKIIDGPGPFDVTVPDVDANDMKALSSFLREEQPDLVSLQEVERIRLPTVDSQAETAAKEAGYDYRYSAASAKEYNLPGPLDPGWEHGNAILIRRRPGLQLTGSRAHALPNAVRGAESRGALAAGVRAEGKALRLIATHLTHNNSDSRRLQSSRLVELLSGPTLLMGDLNARPGAPELAPLEGRCLDVFDGAFAGGPRASIGDLGGDSRIDYVLLCGTGGRALSTWIAGYDGDAIDGFSDHRAVLSVIELPLARSLARAAR